MWADEQCVAAISPSDEVTDEPHEASVSENHHAREVSGKGRDRSRITESYSTECHTRHGDLTVG